MAERDASSLRTRALPGHVPPPRGWKRWFKIGHIAERELAVFWRQLALLIEVGMPLLKALYQVAERTSHTPLRQLVQRVAADIEVGQGLSEALAQHPQAFSAMTVQLLQVAERGGVLDDSLRLVAEELERRVEIRGKLRRALAYPATVLAVGFTVVLFMLAYVIPEFTELFRGHAMPLPLPTRLVIGLANLVAHFWWLWVLLALALITGFTSYTQTPQGRLAWDRCTLRLPLIGPLLRKASILRFAQTLGTLLHGGVPILVSLKLVQEHAENSVLAGELAEVYTSVDQGNRLETSLRHSTVFPPAAIDVIAVGEEAGQVDTVLFRLAQMYKEDVDHSITVFSSILEPLLLFSMGLFVALLVWAIYLPYFLLPNML